jgi:predicted Rossmann fold nucleotide-binding protein DprA/Smf involved in DNA uptake
MKIAIVGSRKFSNLQLVRDFIARLQPGVIVISGGAPGPDRVAIAAAKARGLQTEVSFADWDCGRGAGYQRNYLLVSAADAVVAFFDGRSHGTAHSIKLATEWGKQLTIYDELGTFTEAAAPSLFEHC